MQAGTLQIGNDVRNLYLGVNVVGRESGDPIRNRERIEQWIEEHRSAGSVSALLINVSSVSSKHAIICESAVHVLRCVAASF